MDLVSLEKIQGSVDYSPAWSHYSTSSQATPCPIIQRIYLRMSMERSNICSIHDLPSCFNCQYVLGISHDFLAPFKQRLENFYAVFAMYRNIKDINNNTIIIKHTEDITETNKARVVVQLKNIILNYKNKK